MARVNRARKFPAPLTHGGSQASRHVSPEDQLKRSVLSCFLFESGFYEDGEEIANRIEALAAQVTPGFLGDLAVTSRTEYHLRHVPLLLASVLAARPDAASGLIAATVQLVIQRPDEMMEFLAIHNRNGKRPIRHCVRRGINRALAGFDEYQLAKYDRPGLIKLKTVLKLCHPTPANKAQQQLWGRVLKGELAVPDTWETRLSSGEDKKRVWEYLLGEKKLGGLALLRNLRNMEQAGVSRDAIRTAIHETEFKRVLPFRFLAAARHAPAFEPELDAAMMRTLGSEQKLPGTTIVVVDVSGSMYGKPVSAQSDMTRAHAACALAAVAHEMCDMPVIYATGGDDTTRVHATALVPARRGMALAEAVFQMCPVLKGGGIFLKQSVDFIRAREGMAHRLIVITDEQDCSGGGLDAPDKADPFGTRGNYIVNVASDQHGIGYGRWTKINGFSENVLRYILETEHAFNL